jgi:hypothetical protein
MKQIVFWAFVLIGIYLVATNAFGVNTIVSTLAKSSIQGVAVLQGRDVKGVTA